LICARLEPDQELIDVSRLGQETGQIAGELIGQEQIQGWLSDQEQLAAYKCQGLVGFQ
jgi:hypothetical protein